MSALPPKADIGRHGGNVRFVPEADIGARQSLRRQIAGLTEALADIKMALTDAKEELASKDAEIEKLKKQFQRLADTVEFDGYKYDKAAHTT